MKEFFTRIAATCLLGTSGLFGTTSTQAEALVDITNFSFAVAHEEAHARFQPEYDLEIQDETYAQDIESMMSRMSWTSDTYEHNTEQFEVAFPTKPMDLSGEEALILIAEGNCSVHIFVAIAHNGAVDHFIGNEDETLRELRDGLEASQTLISCSFQSEGDLEIVDTVVFDSQSNAYGKTRFVRTFANIYSLTTVYPAGLADEHHCFSDSFIVLN